MEVQIIEHIRHSLLIDRNKDLIIEKLLNLTLEIISLLTREDFVVVRRSSDHVTEGSATPESDRCSPSPYVEDPPHSPTEEKILEPAQICHGETEEVSGDPQDVSVSVMDYHYTEEDKGAVMVPPQPHSSAGDCNSATPPEQCETPLYSQDCIKEEISIITLDYKDDPGHRTFHPRCKTEETPLDPDGSGEASSRILQERCESPHYPDCMEEEARMILQDFQAKAVDGMFYPQCKEEEIPTPISSGFDTRAETNVEPNGGNDGGLEDLPPNTSAGLSFSHNTDMSHPWKKKQSSDLNTLQIPQPCCVCGKCPFCIQSHTTQQRPSRRWKPFSCPECERCFTVKTALRRHQISHMKKKYPCTECGESFSCKSALNYHGLSHKRHKRLRVCRECRKAFTSKSHLIRHMRVHTGEKPYSCPECPKRFSDKSGITRHLRTHTGERPYFCSECGKCFATTTTLEGHKLVHRRE